jgi:3-methyladenine DNA glycosylase AlkD
MTPARLLERLREELSRAAHPARAPQMQAYMRSAMPYHGVPMPAARQVFRKVFSGVELAGPEEWRDLVLFVWREARFREERHGALYLAGDRRARLFQTMQSLPMYEEIVVTGAWWDFVDDVATHRLPELLRRHPGEMRREMLAWSRSDELWKRRSAILCQLPAGESTDPDLLYRCIEPSLSSCEFFLRKAIGWALRQYARTDPAEVARYVWEHAEILSPLSKREALKHVLRQGLIERIP